MSSALGFRPSPCPAFNCSSWTQRDKMLYSLCYRPLSTYTDKLSFTLLPSSLSHSPFPYQCQVRPQSHKHARLDAGATHMPTFFIHVRLDPRTTRAPSVLCRIYTHRLGVVFLAFTCLVTRVKIRRRVRLPHL